MKNITYSSLISLEAKIILKLKNERTISMKKFKKIIAMCMTAVMLMSTMCVGAFASENVITVIEGENGRWEHIGNIESVMPLATDNPLQRYNIPVGTTNYVVVSPNALVHSGNENAIGIEIRNFTPQTAGLYFNIMNVTDNTWVESNWMGGLNMSTEGHSTYTFSDSYINANRGDRFVVAMCTVRYDATADVRTYTATSN